MTDPVSTAAHLIIYPFPSCSLGFISDELNWILFLRDVFGLLENFVNL